MEKREIVIPTKSIKIEKGTLPESVATIATSPFSDGYDYYAEKERLSTLDELENAEIFELFKEREKLLQQAISERDFFSRRTHVIPEDIDLSEFTIIHRGRRAGKLRTLDRPDSIAVHTNQTAYDWYGRNNANQTGGSIGLRSAVRDIHWLMRETFNDNFYAQNALIDIEKQLDTLKKSIEQTNANLLKTFEQLSKNGINIQVLASENPRKIEVILSNPYAGKIALLLVMLDAYYRAFMTAQNKGLISAKQESQKNTLNEKVRQFCEEIRTTVENLQIIQGFTRRKFMDNQDNIADKITKAVSGELLPKIPVEVLTFAATPQLISIKNHLYSKEDIEKLKQVAVEKQIVQAV